MGIRRVAGLARTRLLMRVDNSTEKGTSGMDKFSSKVHIVRTDLGGKLQGLQGLQGWPAARVSG